MAQLRMAGWTLAGMLSSIMLLGCEQPEDDDDGETPTPPILLINGAQADQVPPPCGGPVDAPPSFGHLASMDLGVTEEKAAGTRPERFRAQLATAIARRVNSGAPEIEIIDAALQAPRSGEAPLVRSVRALLERFPHQRAAVHDIVVERRWPIDIPHLPELIAQSASSDVHVKAEENYVCTNPAVTIGLAAITTLQISDDFTNDKVYCLVAVTDGVANWIRLTETSWELGDGDRYEFQGRGVFFGGGLPAAMQSDLDVSYNCFESDLDSYYSELLASVSSQIDTSGKVVECAGGVCTIDPSEVVNELLAAVAALLIDEDDHLLAMRQIVPAAQAANMTPGVYWNVEDRDMVPPFIDWRYRLELQAWGCADCVKQ